MGNPTADPDTGEVDPDWPDGLEDLTALRQETIYRPFELDQFRRILQNSLASPQMKFKNG